MQARNHGEVLIRVADELCLALGYIGTGEVPGARSSLGEEGVMAGILSPADEALAVRVRASLARLATALGAGVAGASGRAVEAALDGAEMVVRGELVSGNADQLARLMPSFVFLVALPVVGQDRALELSRRAAELLAKATGESV